MPTYGPVIDDNNYQQFLTGGERGYDGMWRPGMSAPRPFAEAGIALIPESEWDDRIRQLERDQADMPTLVKELGLPCLNQASTNYCWCNAPVHCVEMMRLVQSATVVSLSPASVGAPITNFRNVGGWGSNALDYLRENGCNETADWPANTISRSYYTAENREKQKLNQCFEYYKLESWAETASCLLSGIPTAEGFSWWSHEVCGVGLVLGSHDLIIRNSWGMSWGDQGLGTLAGRKKMSDDSVAIVTVKPS